METSPPASGSTPSCSLSRLPPRVNLLLCPFCGPPHPPPPLYCLPLCLPMGTGLVFGLGQRAGAKQAQVCGLAERDGAVPVWRTAAEEEEETGWPCECLKMTFIRKLCVVSLRMYIKSNRCCISVLWDYKKLNTVCIQQQSICPVYFGP